MQSIYKESESRHCVKMTITISNLKRAVKKKLTYALLCWARKSSGTA